MKVPTYQKYGITKSQIEKFDERNRKISQLLTHRIPIAAGIVIGTIFYIINFNKFGPQNVIQFVSQLFLYISLGILCVGIPMIIFKFIENYYYRHIENKNKTYMNILKFKKDKEEFDYWHIRSDERFWKLIDGYTFEREVIGLYTKLGYELKSEIAKDGDTLEFLLAKDDKSIFMKFITNKIIETSSEAESLINSSGNDYDRVIIIASKGYKPETISGLDSKIEIINTRDLIVMVKSINE